METDKVTVEIKSPAAGIITKLFAKPGEVVGVGKPLFGVDVDATKGATGSSPAPAKESPKPA